LRHLLNAGIGMRREPLTAGAVVFQIAVPGWAMGQFEYAKEYDPISAVARYRKSNRISRAILG
jgi:hypothetical protein